MSEATLRLARQGDAGAVHAMAAECPPLEVYPLHQYVILLRTCGDLCCVAEVDGEIVGFEIGFPSSPRQGVYFLWQIGVTPGQRGTGLAQQLLETLERRVRAAGYHTIELTVDPANEPSYRLFRSAGYANVSRQEDSAIEVDGRWAVEDHYGPGRHFVLLAKRINETDNGC